MTWQALGSCRGLDPDLFFPERGASTREAKEVCRGCVVREDCLEYALANGEKFGIWGGLSERERRRLRSRRHNGLAVEGAMAVVECRCGETFIPNGRQRFCSSDCAQAEARGRSRAQYAAAKELPA